MAPHTVDNIHLSNLFTEIADILEIKSDNPFRMRAYRKAAQIFDNSDESVQDMKRKSDMEQLAGIGKTISKQIREFVDTGEIKYHKKLKQQIPHGLLDFLQFQGLTAKKVGTLWHELKVTTIDELKKSAQNGKLKDIPGIGPEVENEILKQSSGDEEVKRETFPLNTILPRAKAIMHNLSKFVDIEQISLVGGLRRMDEMIANIDILIASSQPSKVLDSFTTQPQIEEIIVSNKTFASVRIIEGYQINLNIVMPENFEAALQHYTGSKEHNAQLKKIARKKGMIIGKSGLKNSSKHTIGKSEEEIYSALGLDFIPPELRDGLGEIEAAQKGSLPELIEISDLKGDLHVQSNFGVGVHSIEELVRASKARGYEYIAICDHASPLSRIPSLAEEELQKQIDYINELNNKTEDFHILKGGDVGIKGDGTLDYTNEKLAQLDIVIAAIHGEFGDDGERLTDRICNAMNNPSVNILLCPSKALLDRVGQQLDFDRIIETARLTNTYLELSSSASTGINLSRSIVWQAKKSNISISIASNARNVQALSSIEFVLAAGRKGWLEPTNVLNALSFEELSDILK